MPTHTHPPIPGENPLDARPARVLATFGWTPKSDKAAPATASAKPPKGQPSTNPTSPSVGEEN